MKVKVIELFASFVVRSDITDFLVHYTYWGLVDANLPCQYAARGLIGKHRPWMLGNLDRRWLGGE